MLEAILQGWQGLGVWGRFWDWAGPKGVQLIVIPKERLSSYTIKKKLKGVLWAGGGEGVSPPITIHLVGYVEGAIRPPTLASAPDLQPCPRYPPPAHTSRTCL